MKFRAIMACAVLLPSCSLLVDLQGLSNGAAPDGGAGAGPGDTGAGGQGGAGAGGGGAGGQGGGPLEFFDDFDRADGDVLGNGWTERNPLTFVLQGGTVVKIGTEAGPDEYRLNLVYRPPSEDRLDVEASVEFRNPSLPPGYPQIFVRAQQVGADPATNAYDGYLLYISTNDGPMVAVLGRQLGEVFVETLVDISLTEALDDLSTYRLRLGASGVDPVHLTAYIERLDSAGWVTIGGSIYDDGASDRIATPGAVGFSATYAPNYVYDNFRWKALAP